MVDICNDLRKDLNSMEISYQNPFPCFVSFRKKVEKQFWMLADIYHDQNPFFDPEDHRIFIRKEFVCKEEMEDFKIVKDLPSSQLLKDIAEESKESQIIEESYVSSL